MISLSGYSGERISSQDLLRGIRDQGKNAKLYIDNPQGEITVSTIHRSKGREYDSVLILDDLISEGTSSMEEHRVNYVALSRARNHIYTVKLPEVYFKTLDNRRCYTKKRSFRTGKDYLEYFEIGRQGDIYSRSFCYENGVQEYIRENIDTLKDKEIYLEKKEGKNADYITYNIILKHNGMKLGETGEMFADDLEKTIRYIKNLSWRVNVYDGLFPKRFSGIYVMDVASKIGIAQGDELGVIEYGELVSWNIVLIAGYAKTEF